MKRQMRGYSSAERTAASKAAASWTKFFEGGGAGAIQKLEEIQQTARIMEVQDKHELDLLTMENVVGVAPSMKMTDGKPTANWCLTVLVEKKQPKASLSKEEVVPAEIAGVPTDVIEVGVLEPHVFNAKVRPALPGYSIGHYNITAGTFGCLVRDLRRCCCKLEKSCCCTPTHEECRGDYLILSNNHVLADTNQGKPGDLILQPGPIDGGLYPSDAVATLDRFEPIVFSFPNGYNLVDAAVARPTDSRHVTSSIIGQVLPFGINQAFVGGAVIKAGRTTQVTVGVVLAVNATVMVNYGSPGIAVFRHQIITTAMSAGGDSGSLLMDANLNAVGLLYAGSAVITIHNHIADVETALGVRPLTAPRPS
jgi:hypothetical protein